MIKQFVTFLNEENKTKYLILKNVHAKLELAEIRAASSGG